MKITKKIFGQLILGKIINHIPIEEVFDKKHEAEIKRAKAISKEIIEFAEQYDLFRKNLE